MKTQRYNPHLNHQKKRTDLASANGHVGSMKTLFEHYHPQNQDNKLDLNAKTLKGNTPLHFAIFFQKKKAEEFLLRKGADVSIKNRKGVVADLAGGKFENKNSTNMRDNSQFSCFNER